MRNTLTATALLAMTTAGAATSCQPHNNTSSVTHHVATPTTTTTIHKSITDTWVVTDSYFDPEFGRRTIICVNSGGNLLTATAWQELDIPGSRLGRPCPTGRVLDEGVLGN